MKVAGGHVLSSWGNPPSPAPLNDNRVIGFFTLNLFSDMKYFQPL